MKKGYAQSTMTTILTGLVLAIATNTLDPVDAAAAPGCPSVGIWMEPATGQRILSTDLFRQMAGKPVVLLGETHDSGEHHRWQLQVISALYGINPNMVIGFEAFPRSVQQALDQWTRGDLSEQEFLEKSRWFDVWRFDPKLYMGLFHFARMNRIPMRALNVERSLTRRIGDEGWAAIPIDQRRGIGDPAAPSPQYLASLKKVFKGHSIGRADEQDTFDQAAFDRFVQVQLTWDRAMAEALASARTSGGNPLVIGIVGRGHVEYGYGIPYQLADLGIPGSAVLLPSDSGSPCVDDEPTGNNSPPVAQALYGVSAPDHAEAAPRPLLGVRIETSDTKAVRIVSVMDKSIAQAAGLQQDDLIVQAAGRDIAKTSQLVAIIRAQAAGTWLPLVILRGDQRLDLVARFPAPPPASLPAIP